MNETVSINITTCNRAHLLSRCVRSALEQTYPEIEINIIDDASEDSTEELLQALKDEDPRIHTFRNKTRQGNAASRNRLLAASNASYIAFLDDDDYWTDPQKLEKQVRQLHQYQASNQAAISCTDVIEETTDSRRTVNISMPKNLVTAILRGNGFIFNSTVMTTRQTLDLTKGFDEKMQRGVDSDFFRSAILKHQAIIDFIPEVTTVCSVEGQRMTTSKTLKDRCRILNAHLRIIRKHRSDFIKHPGALVSRLTKLTAALLKP